MQRHSLQGQQLRSMLTYCSCNSNHSYVWQLQIKSIPMCGSYSSNRFPCIRVKAQIHSHVCQLQLKSIPMYGSYSSNPFPCMAVTAQIHSHVWQLQLIAFLCMADTAQMHSHILELNSSNPFPCMAVTAQIHSHVWQLQLKSIPMCGSYNSTSPQCTLEVLVLVLQFRTA